MFELYKQDMRDAKEKIDNEPGKLKGKMIAAIVITVLVVAVSFGCMYMLSVTSGETIKQIKLPVGVFVLAPVSLLLGVIEFFGLLIVPKMFLHTYLTGWLHSKSGVVVISIVLFPLRYMLSAVMGAICGLITGVRGIIAMIKH